MPSSSRRRNSAGAVSARPASARAVLAAVTLSLLLPIMVLSRTVDLVRVRTAPRGAQPEGMPMATKRRPLAGRPTRPLARGPVRPLAGRPVMITGAASGIGRSLARRLSGLGSPVAIADIDE